MLSAQSDMLYEGPIGPGPRAFFLVWMAFFRGRDGVKKTRNGEIFNSPVRTQKMDAMVVRKNTEMLSARTYFHYFSDKKHIHFLRSDWGIEDLAIPRLFNAIPSPKNAIQTQKNTKNVKNAYPGRLGCTVARIYAPVSSRSAPRAAPCKQGGTKMTMTACIRI